MSDFPDNPFIGNPFMKGSGAQKAAASPSPSGAQTSSAKASGSEASSSQTEVARRSRSSQAQSSPSLSKSAMPKAGMRSSPAQPPATGTVPAAEPQSGAPTPQKIRKKTRRKSPAPPPAAPVSNPGYKVQVIAKIPVATNTNLPGRDYLWFAVYPIIPRVGDCIFHNGFYFRVDAVFLYENTTPGWCADLEVSYYARRR